MPWTMLVCRLWVLESVSLLAECRRGERFEGCDWCSGGARMGSGVKPGWWWVLLLLLLLLVLLVLLLPVESKGRVVGGCSRASTCLAEVAAAVAGFKVAFVSPFHASMSIEGAGA